MNQELINKTVLEIVGDKIRPQKNMTLFAAQHLAKKVRAKAKEMGVNAVVAITDRGANPILVECSDHSFIASYDIALNKAFTVVSLKMSTKELSKLAKPDGSLYGIQFTNGGRIVIFGGGEPLLDKNGEIIGAEAQDTGHLGRHLLGIENHIVLDGLVERKGDERIHILQPAHHLLV